VMPYPSDIMKMGTDNDERDVYTILQRIAYPESQSQMEVEYFGPRPIRVLRVTPKAATAASSSTRLGSASMYQTFDTYWVDRSLYEMENVPSPASAEPLLTTEQLQAAMMRLGDAVKQRHGGHWTEGPFLKQWFTKGIECIYQGTQCNLDCPDTLYPLSSNAYRDGACELLNEPDVQNAIGLLADEYVEEETNHVLAWGIPTVCAVLFVFCMLYVLILPPPRHAYFGTACHWCKENTMSLGCCQPPAERDGSGGTWFGQEAPKAAYAKPNGDPESTVSSTVGPELTRLDTPDEQIKAGALEVGQVDVTTSGGASRGKCATCCNIYRYDLEHSKWIWWLSLLLVLILGFGAGSSPIWVRWADGKRQRENARERFSTRVREECDNGHLATIDGGPTRANDFFVVYGINHEATGRAGYSSVTLYNYEKLAGLMAFSSKDGYDGSAQVYLGADDPDSAYLYARLYARDCSAIPGDIDQQYCYSVPSTGNISLPIGNHVMWVVRMYDNPHTHAGPLASETLFDNVVHFS